MCSVGGSLLAGVHLEEMPTSQRTVVQLQQADPAQPKPLIVSVWVQKTVKEKVKLHYVSLKLIEIQLAPTILYCPNSMSSSITDSLTTQWDGSIFEIISAALSYLLEGTSKFLISLLGHQSHERIFPLQYLIFTITTLIQARFSGSSLQYVSLSQHSW